MCALGSSQRLAIGGAQAIGGNTGSVLGSPALGAAVVGRGATRVSQAGPGTILAGDYVGGSRSGGGGGGGPRTPTAPRQQF